MTRRRAFTLIELLVAMSLFAIILPLSGWLIYILLHAQTASANSIADALTRSRFARTFRGDAHAAEKVKVVVSDSGIGSRVDFQIDSATRVSYQSESGGRIVRSMTADSAQRREEFPFAGIQTRFEERSAESTIAAVQTPESPTAWRQSQTGGSARSVRIEAIIGRDRRHHLVSSPAGGKRKI